MPLSVDNIIQRNSGSFSGTTGSVTLPSAATAGNTVIAFLSWNTGTITFTGWTADDVSTLTTPRAGIYRISNVTALSSWTVSFSVTAICTWVIYEVAGLDLDNPLDVKQSAAMANGTGASLSTGLTITSSTFDGLIFALHTAYDSTTPTPGTWSGHTNGLVETQAIGGNDGTKSIGLSVSEDYSLSLQAWSCTATKTATVGQNSLAGIVVYSAAGARRAPDISRMCGFEFGTAAGLATGSTNVDRIFNAVVGTPAVVSTSPRSGAYCLELSSSAAAENLTWPAPNFGASATQQVARFSVYFPTSLPGADVVLFSSEFVTTGVSLVVRFKTATSKLSVQVGAGTEVLSDATVAVNTWISVDYRIDGRTTTHKGDWRVRYDDSTDFVAQTQATGTAGASAGSFTTRIGWTAATTATVRYDDIVVTPVGGHYPLGDIKIVPVGVDPSATVTLSGTTTNFQTFTANGTLVAWDPTVARNQIDEIPPVLGASADGFAQVAVAGSDYVQVPMDTVDAANTYAAAIRGARVYVCGWAASGSTSKFGVRTWDGTTELNLAATGFVCLFDNTSTPAWIAPMIRAATRQDWTQAMLNAMSLRLGFCTAIPAVGVHTVLLEVALRIGDLVRVASGEDGAFTVDARIDPDSSAYIAIIITTPPGTRGATVTWSILSVDQTPVYVPPDTVQTEVIAATDIATFTGFSLETDPA